MIAQRTLVVGLLALVGVAAVSGESDSYSGFMQKTKPGDGKAYEVIGPIDNFNCTHNGAFPHPDSCDLFVDCWEGAAILFRCTDDMLFDLRYMGCEYAQNVHCEDRPRPPGVSSTIQPPVSTTTSNTTTVSTPGPSLNFTCPDDGAFANEEKCEYYWICSNGEASLLHCQLDFLFDLVYMGCNYPELTHCQDRERPPHYPGTTYPPPSTTSTEGPSPTTPVVTEGPTTTENSNVTTTEEVSTTSTLRTTTTGGDFVCPGDGYFADPTDCQWFYHCAFGEPIHEKCPAGLYFNPIAQACDFPENVDCQN